MMDEQVIDGWNNGWVVKQMGTDNRNKDGEKEKEL